MWNMYIKISTNVLEFNTTDKNETGVSLQPEWQHVWFASTKKASKFRLMRGDVHLHCLILFISQLCRERSNRWRLICRKHCNNDSNTKLQIFSFWFLIAQKVTSTRQWCYRQLEFQAFDFLLVCSKFRLVYKMMWAWYIFLLLHNPLYKNVP